MGMKRVIASAAVLVAVVYLKLCIPSFGEEFMPLLRSWLDLEQAAIPAEAVSWLVW